MKAFFSLLLATLLFSCVITTTKAQNPLPGMQFDVAGVSSVDFPLVVQVQFTGGYDTYVISNNGITIFKDNGLGTIVSCNFLGVFVSYGQTLPVLYPNSGNNGTCGVRGWTGHQGCIPIR